MTRDEIQALLRGLLDQLLEDDETLRVELKERGKPIHGHWTDVEDHNGEVRAVEAAAIQRDIQFWRDVQDEGDFSTVDETVDELLGGRVVDAVTRRRLAAGVIETFIKAKEVGLGRSGGGGFTVLDMPAGPLMPAQPILAPPSAPQPPIAPAKPLASTLLDPFFERREKEGVAHRDMSKERTHLRRFLEVCGDRPIDTYHRGDVTGWLNTLRRLPKHNGRSSTKRAANPSVADLIQEADETNAPRLSEKTVENNLATLSAFLRFVVDEGLLTVTGRADLVRDHRFRDTQADNEQRDQWHPEELKKLFSSPVWTGCAGRNLWSTPGTKIMRNTAQFWLPLLALFHGGRLEEFADLYRKDVACDDGTWTIRFVPSVIEEEADGTKRTRKRTLKTSNAKRTIPLHPELIRLGFLKHVEDTAPNQDDPLFPDLKPQGLDGRRGPRLTRWFTNYRQRIGVYREGIAMHAFRHTAITRLSDVITDEQQRRHRDFMMGHSGEGGTEGDRRYDKGPGLKACAATLALLSYPEVNLSHLYLGEEAC